MAGGHCDFSRLATALYSYSVADLRTRTPNQLGGRKGRRDKEGTFRSVLDRILSQALSILGESGRAGKQALGCACVFSFALLLHPSHDASRIDPIGLIHLMRFPWPFLLVLRLTMCKKLLVRECRTSTACQGASDTAFSLNSWASRSR